MSDNSVVSRYLEHRDFSDGLKRALQEVSAEIGFTPTAELDRRTIYDANKVWRVRIQGEWQGKPAVLRLENIKLERDEESIREDFRARLPKGSRVRPPHTYLHDPYDEKKGYGYSLDELVEGESLFDPAGDPRIAAKAFTVFYRDLRAAVTSPFWPMPALDAVELTVAQMRDNWLKLAREKDPTWVARFDPVLERWITLLTEKLRGRELVFMHAHLAGTDVRVNKAGECIVFANHLWSWRQPSYDLAFPTWGQWLARPHTERTVVGIQAVTDAWQKEIATSLGDVISLDSWHLMLLNRIFGALLLDVPAIGRKEGESRETIEPLVEALLEEGKRIEKLIP